MTKGRIPPRLSASYLEHAGVHYLERFASSSVNLKRVLMRKAQRSLAHWGGETAEAQALVDAVIARLAGLGYLDDAAYAGQKAASLHRRGGSTRVIRATLAAKGIDAEQAEAALSRLARETPEPDLAAALAFARRRRLGPFRVSDRTQSREKDLAAMGRAGFDYATARRVVDGDDGDPV